MSDGIRTLALRVTGRVQGVNYRSFVCEAARSLGLEGWVVNHDDGSVEAAATGQGGALAEFIEKCRSGPRDAKVETLNVRSADRGFAEESPEAAYRF